MNKLEFLSQWEETGSSSSQNAGTTDHTLGVFNDRHLFTHTLVAGSPRSGLAGRVRRRAQLLTCRRPPSCCPHLAFPGAHVQRGSSLVSLLTKTLVAWLVWPSD